MAHLYIIASIVILHMPNSAETVLHVPVPISEPNQRTPSRKKQNKKEGLPSSNVQLLKGNRGTEREIEYY